MTESRELIKRILKGEKEAFGIIIEANKRLVSHIISKMVKNREDADDICQEVFVKVYQNLQSFQHGSKLSTWIAVIAYNTGASHLQKKKIPVADDLPGVDSLAEMPVGFSSAPDYDLERDDISARLVREIDRLPPIYGVIMALYHLEEMSYQEIAGIMQMPDGTVKNYLFRARKLLRERLISKYRMEDICL